MRPFQARKNRFAHALMSIGLAAGIVCGEAAGSGFQQRNATDISTLFDPAFVYVETGWSQMVGGNIRVHDAIGATQGGTPVTTGSRSANYLGRPNLMLYTVKFKLGDAVDCMLDSRPSVAVENPPGNEWVGRYQLSHLTVKARQNSITCSYAFQLGKGRLRLIGGYLRTDASLYKYTQVALGNVLPPGTDGDIRAKSRLNGRRWGLAYEIPEYAMRAVLLYQDRMPFTAHGTQFVYLPDGRQLGGAAALSTELPRSWQLDLQSGIREGWLATLSVNWQQWSRLQNLPVVSVLGNGLTAYFRDAWTYTVGVGHSLTPKLSLGTNLSYMQGSASRRQSAYDNAFAVPYTDSWTFGLGGKYKLTDNIAVKAGAFATRLKGGRYVNGGVNTAAVEGGQYGTSWLYTTGASMVVAF